MNIISDSMSQPPTPILDQFAECRLADASWRARSIERWILTLREQIGLVLRLATSPASVAREELAETLLRLRSDMREAENLCVLSAQLTGRWASLKEELERLVHADVPIDSALMRRAVDARALFRSEK